MKVLKTFLLSVSFLLLAAQSGFAASFMYVPIPSQNKVEVFDISSAAVPAKTGEISIPNPQELTVSLDGSKIYVVNGNQNRVSAIDSSNFNERSEITLDSAPKAVAVSPDGQKLYVATAGATENCGGSNVPVGKVVIVNTSNNQTMKTLSLCESGKNGENPYATVMNSDGSRLYILTKSGGFLIKDDSIVKFTFQSTAVALSIRNKNLYVATQQTAQILAAQINIFEEVDNSPFIMFNRIIPLQDISGNNLLKSPNSIAIDPSETKAFISSENDNLNNAISVVDLKKSDNKNATYFGKNTGCGNSSERMAFDSGANNLYVLDANLTNTCVLNSNGISIPQKNSNLAGKPFLVFGNFIGPDISLVPTISVNPTSLTFTDQKIDTISATQRITLSVSNAPLTIQSITVQGNDFTLANSSTCPLNQAINSGDGCFIDVIFAPKAPAENKTGEQIVITTNSGIQKTINLSGNATLTDPPPPGPKPEPKPEPQPNPDSSNNGGGSGGCALNPTNSFNIGWLFLGFLPFLGYVRGRFFSKR